MKKNKKVFLMILDGWGYGKKDSSDAIYNANTPVFDRLIKKYPNGTLLTNGIHVGLPGDQMGNSEVGHLNIGAGRVVYQDLVKINKSIEEKTLAQNVVLIDAFKKAKKTNQRVHFIGLLSDGGIHSHINHLVGLCQIAKQQGVQHSFVHAFTDGRDTDPHSGLDYIRELKEKIKDTQSKIASVIGRYYAMDRDLRWERIQLAYNLMLKGQGEKSSNLLETIQKSYDDGVSDEFIKPIVQVNDKNEAIGNITSGDLVICFNFRTDRCRQITRALTQEDFPDYGMKKIPLDYITMTNYDNTFKNIQVLFSKNNLDNTLGEVLSKNGKTQVRIAETEKYPHVTFFFSGGREVEFTGEKRIMASSPKVATYDLQPEMSANEVKEKIIHELHANQPDFVCLNFANPDMVGHTGVYSAIIKAVETVDTAMGEIISEGLKDAYSFIIIADHGNADFVINEDGSVNTAHTTNPVPVILIDSDHSSIHNGKLADIAPSILKLMGIPIPEEMTGNILF